MKVINFVILFSIKCYNKQTEIIKNKIKNTTESIKGDEVG